jgi:hypothetical protein
MSYSSAMKFDIDAKNLVCWKRGKSGHVKRICLGGALKKTLR